MTTDAIERALERLAPPGASVSAFAVRATDGAVVAASDPDRSIAPASNAKLFTAALALDELGPDYRFETAVATRGRIADRVLDDDLVLRGSGAPDLAPDDLATLADGVADHVDRVVGDLVCDVTRFAGPQLGPGRVWSDERHAYGARSSALALSGNVVDVTVAATDEDVTVSVAPETAIVEIDPAVTPAVSDRASVDEAPPTAEDADDSGAAEQDRDRDHDQHREQDQDEQAAEDGGDLHVRTDSGEGRIRVEGTLPPGAERTVTVPVTRPVRHCGLATRDALAAAGVQVAGEVRVVDDRTLETGAPLAAVESAPLRDLVRAMNVDSDNFVADQLARSVAAAVAGEGSWDGWEETVGDHLDSLGVETVRVRDGSGLSRYDRMPARAVVALLEWSAGRPWRDAFFDSLPGPGEGTLSDRLDGVPVVAKTGTLTGVRALSGRVASGDGDVLFSVLVGGLTVLADEVRGRQDAFVRALADDDAGNPL